MKFFICFLLVVAVHAQDSHNVCELKAETGVCRGSFPRYHFNKATGQCEEFTYGGCGGNGNNFETIEECQKSCATPAHDDCKENEESQECGTACPLTCDNMGNPPEFCTEECVSGCACKKGYVKNAKKECVLPEQCPNNGCKNKHEHHNECGTSCPVTCANYNDTKPQNCRRDCFVGCECDEGFYREYSRFVGRCVAKEDCPVQGETLSVETLESSTLTSSEYISHISYESDSIVRSASSNIGPSPSSTTGNAPIPEDPSPPTPGSTDSNKPAAAAPKNPSKKSNADCNEEPSTCALTKPVGYGYYYNKEAKKCQRFPFANCKGGKNNFSTEEECKNLCIR